MDTAKSLDAAVTQQPPLSMGDPATRNQDQDQGPKSTPNSTQRFLDLFNCYPITREIVKGLGQYEVTSLRLTCHQLYTSLEPTYPKFVQSCMATPLTRPLVTPPRSGRPVYVRNRCESGPGWNGILRTCRGYCNQELGTARLGFSHDSNYLICKPCHTKGLKTLKRWGVRYGMTRYAGGLLPLCKTCYDDMKTTHKTFGEFNLASGPRKVSGCRCRIEFQNDMEQGWFCSDCCGKYLEEKFYKGVWQRTSRLRMINSGQDLVAHEERMYACGNCEVRCLKAADLRSRRRLQTEYYMCGRCEELRVIDDSRVATQLQQRPQA